MADNEQTKGNSQTPEITRRATFKLATAVAAFGAAMGIRANSARAEGKVAIKESRANKKLDNMKGEGSARAKHKDEMDRAKYKEEGSGYLKLKK